MERTGAPAIDELWLRSLQKLAAYVAHDLKGALNGVSVNLEVVRSRSEREGAPASDVQKFSASASEQLAIVIRGTTSLLAASRAIKGPVDVAAIARNLVNVVVDTYAHEGGSIDAHLEGGLPAETGAPGNLVRFAMAEALLAAISTKQPLSIRVRSHPTPGVEITPLGVNALSSDVRTALAGAGVQVTTAGHGISMVFSSPANYPSEEA